MKNNLLIDVKRCAKEKVLFQYYKDGLFYYSTSTGHLFPVPLDDIGSAELLREDKGILFMRYMRKWNKTLEDS